MTLEQPENMTERCISWRKLPLVGRVFTGLGKLLGVEIPNSVQIGLGLHLGHGAVGLVVHESTLIGNDVRLYQGVTLGRGDQYVRGKDAAMGGRIEIANRAIISAGAVVLFRSGQTLRIGEDAIIGANSVVTHDVPAGQIWAGNPARFLRMNPGSQRT